MIVIAERQCYVVFGICLYCLNKFQSDNIAEIFHCGNGNKTIVYEN